MLPLSPRLFLLAVCGLSLWGQGRAGRLLAQAPDPYATARAEMVQTAVVEAGVRDQRVIDAIGSTLRHEFVRFDLRPQAYFDMALPIGDQQTISSPFIVAYMTESLAPQPTDVVLEIGTGSGYQAAVLSPLVKHVYSIEIVEPLGRQAAETLRRLGYENVTVRVGDGFKGWAEKAPFDKIIVTCSPERVPQPLIDQLREGGRIVVPVGERYQQTLYLMTKRNGELVREALRPTLFVPMTGAAEARRQVRPDPARPRAINGDFETPPEKGDFVSGWYYQRQLKWVSDARAPQGQHYITLSNREPGRPAHVLQGLAVDGSRVRELELSAQVKFQDLATGRSRHEQSVLAITFYDGQRRPLLPNRWIGPFQGSRDWHSVRQRFPVPAEAREAILRVGLFGATGSLSVDDLRLTPVVP